MRVLFISTPVLSLFNIKPFAEPNIGGGMVAGGLRAQGIDTDYIDLNSMLMNHRSSHEFLGIVSGKATLSREEFDTLTTLQGLNDYLSGKIVPPRIKSWADFLTTKLVEKNLPDPDVLAVTIERRMEDYYLSYGAFNFLIILRKHLNSHLPKNIPFYVGGSYTLDLLTDHDYLNTVIDHIIDKSLLPNVFFKGQAHNQFSEYLRENLEKDRSSSSRGTINQLLQRDKVKKSFPALTPDNLEDGNLKPDLLFPKNLREKIPELNDIKPFNFYNWKFSEGCIFKCSFCRSGLSPYFEKDDLSYIIDCLQYFNDQGVEYLRFFNDNFNFKQKWVYEFCNEIVKRNIKIKWSDSANMRIGDKDMFQAMADAGCIKLWYGTETVSNRILKLIRKDVKQDRILQVLEWADAAKIWNSCNFIFNFPTETDEEFDELCQFIIKNHSSGLINSYHIGSFRLLPDAEYEADPARFGVKLSVLDKKHRRYQYEEIDGLSWSEICDREERRRNTLLDLGIANANISLHQNDYLFFSLDKIFGKNKKAKIKAMNEAVNFKGKFFSAFISTFGYQSEIYAKWFQEMQDEVYSEKAALEDHANADQAKVFSQCI